MRNFARWLDANANFKGLGLSLLCVILAQISVGGYILYRIETLNPAALSGRSLRMPDFSPFIASADAYAMFDLYSAPIVPYVMAMYVLDSVLPLVYGFFYAVLLGWLLRIHGRSEAWWGLLPLSFLSVPFDLLENMLYMFMISHYPGQLFPTLIGIAGVATALKLLALALICLTIVALALSALLRRLLRKTP